jgi:short-subunit dehydrogenase
MSNAKAHGQAGFRERYGPWAVVTGASDGIGRATAVRLAQAGVQLVLVARNEGRLQSLAGELRATHAVQCLVLPMDLSADGASGRLSQAVQALDIGLLVAAAGFGSGGALLDADLAVESNMVDLNCRSALELSVLLGRRMVARGRGGLMLFSSIVAFQGVPRAANYAATKAYIQTLAEGLHGELAPLGVDVLAVAPGPVHSGFAGRAGMTMGAALTPDDVARGALARLGHRTTARPGWLSWLLEAALAPLPRWARSRVMARVMAGMTAG